jgi:hypothetical protein
MNVDEGFFFPYMSRYKTPLKFNLTYKMNLCVPSHSHKNDSKQVSIPHSQKPDVGLYV